MLLTFLALIYLILRFYFTIWLDSLFPYSSYILELVLILITFAIIKPKFELKGCCEKKRLIFYLGLLVGGFLAYCGAGLLNIQVPFKLEALETLIFLLVVAPILEECVFRFFLWETFAQFGSKIAWVATSLLFSYSHLHAIWFVSEQIHPFIYYQTCYTLFLGFICGYFILRYRSLIGAILLHFFFNLGFYFAS